MAGQFDLVMLLSSFLFFPPLYFLFLIFSFYFSLLAFSCFILLSLSSFLSLCFLTLFPPSLFLLLPLLLFLPSFPLAFFSFPLAFSLSLSLSLSFLHLICSPPFHALLQFHVAFSPFPPPLTPFLSLFLLPLAIHSYRSEYQTKYAHRANKTFT